MKPYVSAPPPGKAAPGIPVRPAGDERTHPAYQTARGFTLLASSGGRKRQISGQP